MLVHVGEVRQAHLAGHMDLPKYHLLFGTVLSTPYAYPPLQRAADASTQVGVSSQKLLEDCNWPQARGRLQ
jgi:hypothetical protein